MYNIGYPATTVMIRVFYCRPRGAEVTLVILFTAISRYAHRSLFILECVSLFSMNSHSHLKHQIQISAAMVQRETSP